MQALFRLPEAALLFNWTRTCTKDGQSARTRSAIPPYWRKQTSNVPSLRFTDFTEDRRSMRDVR